MKNVRMMHLDNGLQLIAEDGVNDTIRNPFQVIIRPGVGVPIAVNKDLIIMSYIVDDNGIITNYKNAVADLKQKRSGIIIPKKSSLDLV